ncbi:MAG: hypothetical protein ACLRS8_05265 [Parabacteroides merdae]
MIDEEDMAKNDKYLMVDTVLRWGRSSPKTHPALLNCRCQTRSRLRKLLISSSMLADNYRLTYFPTQDSLVIEPLNASVMNDAGI